MPFGDWAFGGVGLPGFARFLFPGSTLRRALHDCCASAAPSRGSATGRQSTGTGPGGPKGVAVPGGGRRGGGVHPSRLPVPGPALHGGRGFASMTRRLTRRKCPPPLRISACRGIPGAAHAISGATPSRTTPGVPGGCRFGIRQPTGKWAGPQAVDSGPPRPTRRAHARPGGACRAPRGYLPVPGPVLRDGNSAGPCQRIRRETREDRLSRAIDRHPVRPCAQPPGPLAGPAENRRPRVDFP